MQSARGVAAARLRDGAAIGRGGCFALKPIKGALTRLHAWRDDVIGRCSAVRDCGEEAQEG